MSWLFGGIEIAIALLRSLKLYTPLYEDPATAISDKLKVFVRVLVRVIVIDQMAVPDLQFFTFADESRLRLRARARKCLRLELHREPENFY